MAAKKTLSIYEHGYHDGVSSNHVAHDLLKTNIYGTEVWQEYHLGYVDGAGDRKDEFAHPHCDHGAYCCIDCAQGRCCRSFSKLSEVIV